MSYQKLSNTGASGNDLLVAVDGGSGCCGDPAAIVTYANAATDLTTSGITTITIDGTDYVFAVTATTLALLKTGVDAAFVSAGYIDVGSVSVSTSGAAATAVVTIVTTGLPTKLINVAVADIALAVV